jgi:hypothetical protein
LGVACFDCFLSATCLGASLTAFDGTSFLSATLTGASFFASDFFTSAALFVFYNLISFSLFLRSALASLFLGEGTALTDSFLTGYYFLGDCCFTALGSSFFYTLDGKCFSSFSFLIGWCDYLYSLTGCSFLTGSL